MRVQAIANQEEVSPNLMVVLETDIAYLVAPADDPDGWVARFEKSATFPAFAWAERMAALYNLRLDSERASNQPDFSGSYDPEQNRDSEP